MLKAFKKQKKEVEGFKKVSWLSKFSLLNLVWYVGFKFKEYG